MDKVEAAGSLRVAEQTAVPCSDIAGALGSDAIADGYAIQALNVRQRLSSGAVRSGFKIGLTSHAVQQVFGAQEPMHGMLFADRLCKRHDMIDMDTLCAPRLEGEIVLTIGSVVDPGADDDVLRQSIASVHAAFEIADSRIRDWRIDVGTAIADNACCGLFGIGEAVALAGLDLAAVDMTIMAGGHADRLSHGTGAACLGTPLAAYRWLLGALAARGETVRPGDLILTGALGPMVPMKRNVCYTVNLRGLGTLCIRT